jgi:hypothetical protein
MDSHSDVNDPYDAIPHKLTAAAEGAKRPLTWYDGNKHAFIPIEPDIIDKLGLTRDDLFIQEITSEGILLRRWTTTH